MHKLLIFLCFAFITKDVESIKNINYHIHDFDHITSNIFRNLHLDEYEQTTPAYEENCLKNYPIIIPIGCACRTALRLRLVNVRKLAYPFDWYAITLDTVYRIISENFANFTNEKYIDKFQHSIYGITFVHDFTFEPNFNQETYFNELHKMQQKYNARIMRFYKAINMPKPIFLLYIAPDREWYAEKTSIDFAKIWLNKLSSLLKKFFPTANITLIYADFSPRIGELRDIPLVKAYQIKYPLDISLTEPNKQLVTNEWRTILKDVGIFL